MADSYRATVNQQTTQVYSHSYLLRGTSLSSESITLCGSLYDTLFSCVFWSMYDIYVSRTMRLQLMRKNSPYLGVFEACFLWKNCKRTVGI
jgi:hypothetical protein